MTVLERDVFPRYHIGESMLPSFNAFLDFIGAKEKVKKCGFVKKVLIDLPLAFSMSNMIFAARSRY